MSLQVCREEHQSGGLSAPLWAPILRTATLTGVSSATIHRRENPKDKPERKVRIDKYELDDFDKCVVRRTVNDMLTKERVLPTIKRVRERLVDNIQYRGGEKHLRSTLHELGFSWKRTVSNRKILMERPDVVAHRIQYLRKMKQYRDAGRPIVYTDETFVHANHTMHKCWQSDEISLKAPFSKGDRLIILHAGSEQGFIEGADLIFKSKTRSGDYHDKMNSENFQKWLSTKLIPNLPANCVLVIDNAAYHNVQVDKCPTQGTKKADI